MMSKKKHGKRDYIFEGYSFSVAIHLLIFLSALIILKLFPDKPVINSVYLDIVNTTRENNLIDKNPGTDKKEVLKSLKKKNNFNNSRLVNYALIADADTSNLKQIYRESSLNVSIRYPNGWTYIDQDVKDKLDGVTFWFTNYQGLSAPYVHLEVRDKDIFIPGRFKYHTKLREITIYYNDPAELEGQVSQEVYIRTGSDEDFSIKLIIKGKEEFKLFQPDFFAMIKSFKFGNSIFN